MQSDISLRRVERVRHDLVQRELVVSHVEQISPSYTAVTLSGPELRGFTSLAFDDHIKIFFSDETGQLQRRDYTPRRYDPMRGDLVLEFCLHEGGLASAWAERAKVGNPVKVAGPRGSFVVPMDYDWHLLVGDATALPAIARRLEELPSGTRVDVVAQVPQVRDQRIFDTRATVHMTWVNSLDELVQRASACSLPSGEGFVWAAGEASTMAKVRQHWIALGQPREAMRISAYWKPGVSSFHENLES